MAAELLIPHSRYDIVAKLHAAGQVRTQESRDDGVLLAGRFPQKARALFAPFLLPEKPKKAPPRKRPAKA